MIRDAMNFLCKRKRRITSSLRLTRLGYAVTDVAAAVLAILEVDLSFARTLDRHGQSASAGFAGPDVEFAGFALLAPLETGTTGVNPVSAAIPQRTDGELERRARDVHLLVTNRHRVNAEFLRHEGHCVETVLDLLYLGVFGNSAGRRDRRCQIEGRYAGHFEGELALAADLSDRHGLATSLYLLALPVASLAGDLDGERRSLDVMIGKFEIHYVVAGLGRLVRDVERTVGVILALDLGLARSFHRQGQTTETGVSRVDRECVLHMGLALLKGVTGNLDLLRVADLAILDVDLERRIDNVLAHLLHRHDVLAGLPGRERHAHVAVRHLLQETRLLETARRCDRRIQRTDVRVRHLPW